MPYFLVNCKYWRVQFGVNSRPYKFSITYSEENIWKLCKKISGSLEELNCCSAVFISNKNGMVINGLITRIIEIHFVLKFMRFIFSWKCSVILDNMNVSFQVPLWKQNTAAKGSRDYVIWVRVSFGHIITFRFTLSVYSRY